MEVNNDFSEHFSAWLRDTDLSLFGGGYVLMQKLYVSFILYCSGHGIDNLYSDRVFSKALQDAGYLKKYTNKGTAFCLDPK